MRIFAAFGIALLLASCASGGGRSAERERFQRIAGKPVANPSAVVKAELAFARLAQEKGQWTAFRETAADDAVMFVPNLQSAGQWLKGKVDPAKAVTWQPHKIIVSCDGSMALSQGAWQNDKGGTGQFWTVWRQEDFGQRRLNKPIEWKWVFDHGVPTDEPLAEPDFVETSVASCQQNNLLLIAPPLNGGTRTMGHSADRSLIWRATQNADQSRSLVLKLWNGSAYVDAVSEDFGAPSE